LNLVRGLAPAYLRIGGTAADLVVLGKKSLHQKVKAKEQFCYCTANKGDNFYDKHVFLESNLIH
jgi:hypothetical protein